MRFSSVSSSTRASACWSSRSTTLSWPSGPRTILNGLVPEPDVEHLEGFLGDDVGIGLDLAGHHDFAQSERALDDHPVLRTVARVGGERDAGLLGVDHLLDHHRHGGVASEVAAGAVGDHARARTATSSSEAPHR